MTATEMPRPFFRGHLHLLMALASGPALAALLLLSNQPREYLSAGVYGGSMLLLYSVSAGHHLGRPSPFVHRLDRAMIFVLIAGTYTPFCLMVLCDSWGIPFLAAVWGLAAVSGAKCLLRRPMAGWPNIALYLASGWVGIIAVVPFLSASTALVSVLVISGALIYSLGGLVHATKRPDPLPGWFGYHEVFHALSVVAGGLFFVAVVSVLRNS